jgi:hypothetical protein
MTIGLRVEGDAEGFEAGDFETRVEMVEGLQASGHGFRKRRTATQDGWQDATGLRSSRYGETCGAERKKISTMHGISPKRPHSR